MPVCLSVCLCTCLCVLKTPTHWIMLLHGCIGRDYIYRALQVGGLSDYKCKFIQNLVLCKLNLLFWGTFLVHLQSVSHTTCKALMWPCSPDLVVVVVMVVSCSTWNCDVHAKIMSTMSTYLCISCRTWPLALGCITTWSHLTWALSLQTPALQHSVQGTYMCVYYYASWLL